jgi:hypothetical protein
VKRVEIILDTVNARVKAIQQITKTQVFIGIPESKTSRKSNDVTNAQLGYIHEFGSPARNIPARPWLIPGVRKAARDYMPHLRGAAEAALDGKPTIAIRELNEAGLIASQSAKRTMATGNFVPLSPATVRQRQYARGTQSMRTSEKQYLALVKQGVSPATAQLATGIRPLINTRQLFNSVTYVLTRIK